MRVKLPCPRTQHNGTGQGSKPEPLALELIALTMKPPHLSQLYVSALQYLGTGQKVQGGGGGGGVGQSISKCGVQKTQDPLLPIGGKRSDLPLNEG